MVDTKLYKVAITVAGDYVHGTSYDTLTMVLNNTADGGDGCCYVSVRPSQNVKPGTDATVWKKVSERGASGQNGTNGTNGAQGPMGPAGVTDAEISVLNTTGTPTALVSVSNGLLSIELSGIKGEQGNTGSSVDYPYELVNNLTTNDAEKGLSAAQGVALKGQIDDLHDASIANKYVELTYISDEKKYVDNDHTIVDSGSASYRLWTYEVLGGATYAFSGRMGATVTLYFVNWYDSEGVYLSRSLYKGNMDTVTVHDKQIVTAPSGAAFAKLNVQGANKGYYHFYRVSDVTMQEVYNELQSVSVRGIGDLEFDETPVVAGFASGGVSKTDGSIYSSESFEYTTITLNNASHVRFLGNEWNNGVSWSPGYAFYDSNDDCVEVHEFDSNGTATTTKEYVVDVPNGAVTFKTVVYIGSNYEDIVTEDNFYCYLQYGDTVKHLLDKAVYYDELANNPGQARYDKATSVEFVNKSIIESQDWNRIDVDLTNVHGNNYALYLSAYSTVVNHKHIRVPVFPGDIVKITTNATIGARMHVLYSASREISGGTIPSLGTLLPYANKTYYLLMPDGACAFATNITTSDGDVTPASISVYRRKTVEEEPAIKTLTAIPARRYNIGTATQKIITGSQSGATRAVLYPVKQGRRYLVDYDNDPNAELNVIHNIVRFAFIRTLPYNTLEINDSDYFHRYHSRSAVFSAIAPFDGYLFVCGGTQPNTEPAFTINSAKELIEDNSEIKTVSDLVRGQLNQFEDANISALTKRNGTFFIHFNTYGSISSSAAKHVILPVNEGNLVKVVVGDSGYTWLAWLTSGDSPVKNQRMPIVPDTTVFKQTKKEAVYFVPAGTHYMFVYCGKQNAGYPASPSYVGICSSESVTIGTPMKSDNLDTIRYRVLSRSHAMELTPLNINVGSDGWELPTTVQQLNTIKKCLQMCKIKWTPLKTLPGKNNPTQHQAGVQQTGIPYTGNWHEYKYVGIEVSIHTFMTAVHNPYSLMYTENIYKDTSKSAWGKVYYNSNGWTYYGTVCCGMSASVNAQPTKYGNTVIPKIARHIGIFIPIIDDRNFNNLKIGDVYDNDAHSFVIYGLHRDANGNVDKIKKAESTSSVHSCQIVTYTKSSFTNYINREGDPFYGYRVADLYKNIYYEPSPYVPLTEYGETATTVTYNDDICCFAGDKATFMQGDRVAINYNLTENTREWGAIELYKDDVLLNTYLLSQIDQSSLDESLRNHTLDLGTTLEPGKYKARMTYQNEHSDYTYFEVLHNDISVTSLDGGLYRIQVNSGEPLKFVYCGRTVDGGEYYSGTPSGYKFFMNNAGREPDWAEALDNRMDLYFDSLLKAWGMNIAINHEIRVMLQGEYGMAATPPITLPGRGQGTDDGTDQDDD